MTLAYLFDTVVDEFLAECENKYQYMSADELIFDQIFNDTIDAMIGDERHDALNNDNIVGEIYNHIISTGKFDGFIEEKREEEREAAEFARDPYSFLGLSWNDFI